MKTLHIPPSSAHSPSRSRWVRLRRRVSGPAPALLLAVPVLLALAWTANAVEQERCIHSRRCRVEAFERDQLNRGLSRWLFATSREQIVSRAQTELGMIEPAPDKEVVALDAVPRDAGPSPLLRTLAQGLDRYGRVRGAMAEERDR